MIEGLMLASGGYFGSFYGGSIGDLLASWEQAGVFSYMLPFLLIFALVFGILTRVQVFKDNRAINGIIALVVGLLALQFDLVPIFFSEVFPRLGVALSVILALLILVGLFVDPDNKAVGYGLLGIALIIFIIVIVQTAGWVGWQSGFFWYDNWPAILGVLAFFGLLIAIIASVGPKRNIPALKMLGFR
jgi:hypothetical protein